MSPVARWAAVAGFLSGVLLSLLVNKCPDSAEPSLTISGSADRQFVEADVWSVDVDGESAP